jgi:hypothetical protein
VSRVKAEGQSYIRTIVAGEINAIVIDIRNKDKDFLVCTFYGAHF